MNADTAARIRQAAAALGYRANSLARALPTGRTSMIALAISDITIPFYNEIICGAQAIKASLGLVPAAPALLAMLMFIRYPLTEKRYGDLVRETNARKLAALAAPVPFPSTV